MKKLENQNEQMREQIKRLTLKEDSLEEILEEIVKFKKELLSQQSEWNRGMGGPLKIKDVMDRLDLLIGKMTW